MQSKTIENMPQDTTDKIEYLIMLIKLFAERYRLSPKQAYRYIRRYGGVGFVERNYSVLHTLPFDDMVDTMSDFCKKSGGLL